MKVKVLPILWIVSIFSLQYIQCNERVKVLYILLCNIFNHMKKYKFQTDPSSEFQTRSSSELVSWHRTYFSKLDPVRNSELGAVWKMLPFNIMPHCTIGCNITIIPHIAPQRNKCYCSWVVSRGITGLGVFLEKYCFLDRSQPLLYFVP